MAERAIVMYDRDCGFCRWALSKVLAWDRGRRLRVAPLDGPTADRLLGDMPDSKRMSSWHLAFSDASGTRLLSAGHGLAPLMRMLPAGAPLGRLFEAMPGLAVRGYTVIAGNRSRLGRFVTAGAKRRADARIEARSEGVPDAEEDREDQTHGG